MVFGLLMAVGARPFGRVGEDPLAPGLMALGARVRVLIVSAGRLVAVRARGGGHVVAGIARRGDVAVQVRLAVAYGGYTVRLTLGPCVRVQDPGFVEGAGRDGVPGIRVAIHACAIRCVFLVRETIAVAPDVVMAGGAALVRYLRGLRDGESRVLGDMGPHLLQRHHLVSETVQIAVSHVTCDTVDARVRPLCPGVVERLHLVAGRAEDGLVRRPGGTEERQQEHDRRDADHDRGPSLMGEYPGTHASHVGAFPSVHLLTTVGPFHERFLRM